MARPSIQEAIAILLQNEPAPFRLATETLFKIVQNLLTQPDEPKNYRRVHSQALMHLAQSWLTSLDAFYTESAWAQLLPKRVELHRMCCRAAAALL